MQLQAVYTSILHSAEDIRSWELHFRTNQPFNKSTNQQMTPPEPKDFFDLKIDEEGVRTLEKLSRLTKWIYFMGFFLCLATFGDAAFRFRTITSYGVKDWMSETLRLYPYFLIIIGLIYYLQIRHFFLFGKKIKQAITHQDSSFLNKGLASLYRSTSIGLMLIIVNLIVYGVTLYIYYQLQNS